MMTEMHTEIDEYLSALLEERRERKAQLAKEDAERADAAEAEMMTKWYKFREEMRIRQYAELEKEKRDSVQSA